MREIYTKNIINLYRLSKANVYNSKVIHTESDIVELIRAYIGIHSARIGKPYISLLNKGFDMHISEIFKRIIANEDLIQRRSMRKTLHISHVDDIDMIHYSTKRIRISSLREVIGLRLIESSTKVIVKFLDSTSSSLNELYGVIVKECNATEEEARSVVKYHYENGLIFFKNISNDPFKEIRQYSILEKDLLNLSDKLSEQEYINQLVMRYISQFGPVSVKDIQWWTGISKRKIETSVVSNKSTIMCIYSDNPNIKLYTTLFDMQNLEYMEKTHCTYNWCKFMSYEDSALKAYFETRTFYSDNPKEYFNKIGEIYATILLNGKCVGLWDLDLKKQEIIIKKLNCPSYYKKLIAIEKNRMESLLF